MTSAHSLVFPCCCYSMISVTLLRESQTTLVATVPKRWFTLCLPKTNRGTLAISFSDGGDFISYAHRLFPLCMCLCMRGRERWWVVRWLVPGMFHDVLPYREGPQPGRLRLTARPCRSSCSHSLSPSPPVLSWKICQPVFISKEDLHYHLVVVISAGWVPLGQRSKIRVKRNCMQQVVRSCSRTLTAVHMIGRVRSEVQV